MLTGLDILLDRMKTNPEEFLNAGEVPYEGELFGGKWADLIRYAWRVGTEEERKMLEDAQIQFYRDDFNGRVMKRLAGEETKEELSPYIVKQNPAQPIAGLGVQGSILQGVGYDPNLHGYLTTTGSFPSFQAAEAKQEGAPVGGVVGNDFWGGIVASGKGRFWR